MTSAKWNEFKGALVKFIGVLVTTYNIAVLRKMVDINSLVGQWLGLGAAVATVYGIVGAYTYRQSRTPWTPEQKLAESKRRIADGEAPLQGYEFLLVDPTATKAPPAVTPSAAAAAVGSASTVPKKEG